MWFFNKRSSKKPSVAREPTPEPTPEPTIENGSTQSAPTRPVDLPDELVAARAYEIWQRRGSPTGQDTSVDWLAAKSELEQERLGWAAPTSQDRAS
jgi:hypothetical protein